MIGDKIKNGAGYTLIELVVVCAIFSIIIVAVFGIFVSAIRAQRYSMSSQQILDQSSYAIEYMGKALRMAKKATDSTCIDSGRNYQSKTIPDTSFTGLMFLKSSGVCKGYYLNGGRLYDYEVGRDPLSLPLTSDKLQINDFKVNISDASGVQPRVTILIDIQGKNLNPAPRLRIQTTISQRNPNI